MLTSWSSQNSARSGTRAIVPSSFITSQTTPAGMRPASRARSTAASVCPVRSRTPPERARSGKTWPGWTRSWAPRFGSIAVWIVRERSAAEIPVVTPSRASIETVNAVWSGASLFSAIGRRPSSSTRSGVMQRQISPRACVAMKLIASGVANCAAIVRSPSFSRSAASTTTTNLPSRMSSIACSTVAKAASVRIAIGGMVSGRNSLLDNLRPRNDRHRMRLRKAAALLGSLLIRAVLFVVLIALALLVLAVGIAVMRKEPQGIVAIGTLGLCALLVWGAFYVAFSRESDGGETPDSPESSAGS